MYTFTKKTLKTKALAMILALSVLMSMTIQAFALQERDMVPGVLVQSEANVLNSDWLQIYMRELEYNAGNVANTSYYTITSTDDPEFFTPVVPSLVHNRYFPEDGPWSDTVSAANIANLNMIYRISLKMPSARKLKEGKTYTVAVNPAVANVGPLTASFDINIPNDVIHVNQVGYITDGSKVAYLSWWTGQGSISFASSKTFQVIDESTGNAVYTGSVNFEKSAAEEKWGGSDLYSMDFTSFKPEGTYHLYVPGVGRSYSFKISSSIYKDKIGYTLIRGLTMQRDGDHGLDDPNVTNWNRPSAHLDDAIEESTGNQIDLTGGHMDAGDRGKYPYNVAAMVMNMLEAATLFPEQVEALGESLEIQESDNDIPDFIDELVYELDFLHKLVMNTSKDGALAAFVRPANAGYESGYPMEGATGRKYFDETYGPFKAHTLYGAGALAMAANADILKAYLPAEKIEGYKVAALRAFNAFETHKDDASFWKPEESQYGDNFRDNVDAGTPNTWSEEMLVAAANLHALTGEQKYLDWINQEMSSKPLGVAQKKWGWVNEGPWLDVYFSLWQDENLDSAKRDEARNAILDWANDAMKPENVQPYGVPYVDATYNQVGWYFSGSAIGFPMMMAYGVSGDQKYRDQLIKTWNYLLGSNPLSNSYISGLGDPQKSPKWLCHEISQNRWTEYKDGAEDGDTGWSEIIPGIPNADLQQGTFPSYLNDGWNSERVNKQYPALEKYPALYRYTDTWNTTNEFITVWVARQASSIIALIPTGLHALVTTAEHGTIDITGGSYEEGTQLLLTATPDLGYAFTGWSGDITSSDNPVLVTMDTDKNIIANFEPVETYTLTGSAINGTIVQDNPDGVYNPGTKVTIRAVPDSGYRFSEWSGDISGTTQTAIIVMDGNKSITAEFVPAELGSIYFGETAPVGGHVLRSPHKDFYEYGEQVLLEAIPDSGYRFSHWNGDVSGSSNPVILTMGGNKTAVPVFEEIPTYTLSLSATEGGSVSPASGEFSDGTQVTLIASAQPGYMFTGWSGDYTGTANPANIIMDGDKTITAIFQSTAGIISTDITTVHEGSTTEQEGVYTIVGYGEQVGSNPDSFRYVHEMGLKGNFSIIAKLDSMAGDNPNGMAGLMIRTNAAAGAPYAAVYVQKNPSDNNKWNIVVRWRKGGDYSDTVLRQEIPSSSIWMKIERGSMPWQIKTMSSSDGVNWTELAGGDFWGWMNANDPMLTAGMFVNSGSPDQWPKSTTAQFSNVTWPRDPNSSVPVITVNQTSGTVKHDRFTISGTITQTNEIKVKVNDGIEQTVTANAGIFNTTVSLTPGENTITISAADGDFAAVPVQLLLTYNQPSQVTAYLATVAPVVDGSINDAAWNGIINNDLTRIIQGETENTVKYGLLWDNQYLYVAAEVTDSNVIERDAFGKDGVEVYVDMLDQLSGWNNTKNSQLAVAPGDNTVTSWRLSTGVIANSIITDNGYTMEMAIPWSTFGVTPATSNKIGFDLGMNDDDTGGGRTGVMMWSGTMDNWKQSNDYGEAVLAGAAANYTSLDIGTTYLGSTNVENGVYTIKGHGATVWAVPDSFRYVYEAGLSDNFSIKAKLDSITGGNNHAMAGLMVRMDTTASAPYAAVFVQKNESNSNQWELVVRCRRGGAYSEQLRLPIESTSIWMKIERGELPWQIVISSSDDGVNWNQLAWPNGGTGDFWAFATYPEGAPAQPVAITAGLFMNSGTYDEWATENNAATAKFSNVKWASAPETVPVPVITLDQADETVNSDQYTVSGTITNATEVKVQVNGGSEQTVTANGGIFNIAVTLTSGVNTIIVSAEGAEPVQLQVTYDQPSQGDPYTLSIGTESNGGVGKVREITIGGNSAGELEGKYLVVQLTEGTGVNAKVSVVMVSLTGQTVTISYKTAGTKVEAWLVSGMPNLAAEDIGVTLYAYTVTEQ